MRLLVSLVTSSFSVDPAANPPASPAAKSSPAGYSSSSSSGKDLNASATTSASGLKHVCKCVVGNDPMYSSARDMI